MNSKEDSSSNKPLENRGQTGTAVAPRDLKALRLPRNPEHDQAVTREEIEAGDILFVHLIGAEGKGQRIAVVTAPYRDQEGRWVMDVRPITGLGRSIQTMPLVDLGIIPYRSGKRLVWSSTVYVTKKPRRGRD